MRVSTAMSTTTGPPVAVNGSLNSLKQPLLQHVSSFGDSVVSVQDDDDAGNSGGEEGDGDSGGDRGDGGSGGEDAELGRSASAGSKSLGGTSVTSDDNEPAEEVPSDLQALPVHLQQRRIKMRAAWMMTVGMLVVLLFSDPMVRGCGWLGRGGC